MKKLTQDEIETGCVACVIWHYVGDNVVAPFRITTLLAKKVRTAGTSKIVNDSMVAVLEAGKAINKMMGKHATTGMYDSESN